MVGSFTEIKKTELNKFGKGNQEFCFENIY